MTVEYIGGGMYKGTIPYANGKSCLYHSDRQQLTADLIEQAFGEKEEVETGVAWNEPVYREEEEAWTDDDWERDFVETEEFYKHKDDDKV